MLPFLEIDIVIENTEGKKKEVKARIQPNEIEYYYPGFNFGTVVVMKSGQSYLTLESVSNFDNILAEYSKILKSNSGKFGNVSITPKKQMHATS